MRFDANKGRFYNAKGKELAVVVTMKNGRYYYRTEGGRILASGMTPAKFAREFWFAELDES